MNGDPKAFVLLNKTEAQGDFYDEVLINGQNISYPKPFLFTLSPTKDHPHGDKKREISLCLSIYDNAGESFLPSDGDSTSVPVTRHLAMSNAVFFLFDPLQDTKFREVCQEQCDDPQIKGESSGNFRRTPIRQEMVLIEMINRIRSYRRMLSDEMFRVPVIFIVTKFDAWRRLLSEDCRKSPWVSVNGTAKRGISQKRVQRLSDAVRHLLSEYNPEIIGMLEQFASDVTYLPVSATGGPPQQNPDTGQWGFQVNHIEPWLCDLPIIYTLAKQTKGMFPMGQEEKSTER